MSRNAPPIHHVFKRLGLAFARVNERLRMETRFRSTIAITPFLWDLVLSRRKCARTGEF